MKRKTHTIDASDRVLGRLAVQVAGLLRGKGKSDFAPNEDKGVFVVIKNIDKIKITGKKLQQKKYFHHSGYLGGVREVPQGKVFKKKPLEVLRKAVWGMLPKNKLRDKMIKRLKISR